MLRFDPASLPMRRGDAVAQGRARLARGNGRAFFAQPRAHLVPEGSMRMGAGLVTGPAQGKMRRAAALFAVLACVCLFASLCGATLPQAWAGILHEEMTTSERPVERLTPMRRGGANVPPESGSLRPAPPVDAAASDQYGTTRNAPAAVGGALSSGQPPRHVFEPAEAGSARESTGRGAGEPGSRVVPYGTGAGEFDSHIVPDGTGAVSAGGSRGDSDDGTANASSRAHIAPASNAAGSPAAYGSDAPPRIPADAMPARTAAISGRSGDKTENLLDGMDVYALSPHAVHLALPRMIPVEVVRRVRSGVVPPASWVAIIQRASRLTGLDSALITAVIRAESGFDVAAVSNKGAQGPMQIMPATQRELGLDDAFDAEANVEAGSRYLQQQLQRFGSVELALAAYNAGPGNVLRYGGIPPFTETENFVKRVLAQLR